MAALQKQFATSLTLIGLLKVKILSFEKNPIFGSLQVLTVTVKRRTRTVRLCGPRSHGCTHCPSSLARLKMRESDSSPTEDAVSHFKHHASVEQLKLYLLAKTLDTLGIEKAKN